MKNKLIIVTITLFMALTFAACEKESLEAEVPITEEASNITEELTQGGSKIDVSAVITTVPSETPEATITPTNENVSIDVMNDPILMATPPFSYYISDNSIGKEISSIKLNQTSCLPNEIIDDEEWFIKNNLTMNRFQVPNTFRDITGNLSEDIATVWSDLIITSAYCDDVYIYCTYGSNYSEGYILNVYDATSLKIVYSFDFSNYRYSPDYIEEDYDYIQQKINWASIKDDILYVSSSHNTYAKSSNNMNAYITAIDLADMNILWRTNALVSNAYNFVIIDDVIICGYGFTDEPDYLYQVNITTGEVIGKLPLKTAATYIIRKDNTLYVRTYNTNYEFDISH